MVISPRLSMWINVIVAIAAAIAGGAINLTDILPAGEAHSVVSWCAFTVAVYGVANGVLHGYSSPQAGPGATTRTLFSALFCVTLVLGLVLSPSNSEGAETVVKTAKKPSGTILSDIYTKIQSASLEDLKYADGLALATDDTIAHTCWAAWIAHIEKEQKANNLPPPEPHLITDVQRLLNMNSALSSSGPLAVACAPLSNKMKTDVFSLLSSVALGSIVFPAIFP